MNDRSRSWTSRCSATWVCTPEAARAAVLDIARACRRFRGDLGILWHNDEVLRTARQQRWYADLVEAVTA